IENHPIGAKLLRMRRRRQDTCLDAAALLRFGIEPDHRLAVLVLHPKRNLDGPFLLLDGSLLAAGDEPPAQENAACDDASRNQQLHRPRTRRFLLPAHAASPTRLVRAYRSDQVSDQWIVGVPRHHYNQGIHPNVTPKLASLTPQGGGVEAPLRHQWRSSQTRIDW